jgi:hypothetical protein
LLASDRDGELKFAGPAILQPSQKERAHWTKLMAALAVAKPPLKGLQGLAQWLRPELRVRVRHLRAKGVLRAARRHCQAAHYGVIPGNKKARRLRVFSFCCDPRQLAHRSTSMAGRCSKAAKESEGGRSRLTAICSVIQR